MLEAVGNDSSREMVIAPQGVQNPAYNYPKMKAPAYRGGLLLYIIKDYEPQAPYLPILKILTLLMALVGQKDPVETVQLTPDSSLEYLK